MPWGEHILRQQSFLPLLVQLCLLQFLNQALLMSRRICWQRGGTSLLLDSLLKFWSHCHASKTSLTSQEKQIHFWQPFFLDLEVQTVKATELFKKLSVLHFQGFLQAESPGKQKRSQSQWLCSIPTSSCPLHARRITLWLTAAILWAQLKLHIPHAQHKTFASSVNLPFSHKLAQLLHDNSQRLGF